MSRLPDFAIIGAMKCGTSSLHDQLAARDAFYMSVPKEPNFFSDDAIWNRGINWYAGLFSAARDEQICGESSTHYTKLPTYSKTVERMHRHLPHARLVYVMRHPIERIVSQYIHEWTQCEVRGDVTAAVQGHNRFLAYSCYARQLEPFLRAWGPERVLPVFFERLTREPDAELRRICAFLGDPAAGAAHWSEESARQNVSSERLRKSRVRDLLLGLAPVRALKNRMPQGWRDGVKGLWQMRRRPELPMSLRGELERAVDDDLSRLSQWLGRPLSCASWEEVCEDEPPAWAGCAPGATA